MAKHSNYDIPDLNSDWANNPTDHLPQSGDQVQRFIRNQLGVSIGAAWFNSENSMLYFFRSVEDRDAYVQDPTAHADLVISTTRLDFTSNMYRIYVTNNLPSYNIQVATNETSVLLSLNFDVQTKTISDTSWTSTGDGVNAAAYIDAGSTGNYVLIPGSSRLVLAGNPYEVEVRNLLMVGDNRVKIVLTDENDETLSTSVVYAISLLEMYIEPFQNTWYEAIVEGIADTYKLGGFKIVGSLYKTLHIEISQGQSSSMLSFEKVIGTGSYVDVPYNFTAADGLDLSPLPTGVYICKAYLTSGSLTSLPISYSFMHVAEEDRNEAQLVCVNNVAPKVYNYSTAQICDYSIYNAGFSTGIPHILIQLWSGNTPYTKVDRDFPDTTANVLHTLEYTIEWNTDEYIDLKLYFRISLGSSEQVQTIPIDNSAIYPADMEGLVFYLNASSRSNQDNNKTQIINEATTPNSSIQAIWERMAWVDGIDGWTPDEYGRRSLLIPAASSCTIPYQIMTGAGISFELCFRVANVSDYSENIITIAENALLPGFQGIRIRPTNITIHSSADIDASQDTLRGKSFADEETVHLFVTIQNAFGGFQGKNLVCCYINGCLALEFSYDSGTAWDNNANFVIGSSSSDIYIYFCRAYNRVLSKSSVEKNYINSLRTLDQRAAAYAWFNSVLAESLHDISYDKMIDANTGYNYNFFVVEMKNGLDIPSLANGWSKDNKGYADFEMHYGDHPEWDFKLFNVEISGQGTTSMDYYRWNLRWRIDKSNDAKKVPVSYYDAPTIESGKKIFHPLPASDSKTVLFDGGYNSTQNHPAVKRITAKINQASSMQSHKIGATRAFNDLHSRLELLNAAQAYAESNNLPIPTVAVYQYPAFGFSRTVNQVGVETYQFIGLFTIGPDKGDKPTFGYDITDNIKEHLITIEGTDHSHRMTNFQYPWNLDVRYLASNECINIVKGVSDFDNGWEVGNCFDLSTDKASDQDAIAQILETEFKPAYLNAWNNSTLIFPIALNDPDYGGADAAAVLANINNDIINFRAKRYNSRFSYADMEFWIEGEYTLYYYDIVTNVFVADVNLITDMGTPPASADTLDKENEWFKAERRSRFLSTAANYWDVKDAIYHLVFCVIFGATDNFAKNTYPYKMGTLASGGRWKWRQDDLDTIFDIDNRGSDSKPYYIEYEDSVNGSLVFAGSNSVFWNLIWEVFYEDYNTQSGLAKGVESIGKDTLKAMANIGGGSNDFEGITNFFKKYFWDNAQNYFPQSGYNTDANWKYELAWLDTVHQQSVDPLSQSLGRHLEAEFLWCERRIVYMMSLFKVGDFSDYSNTTLGRISFRPYNLPSVTVTPTMWIYPALIAGAGSPEVTARTEEGDSHEFIGPFSTDGQTTIYIKNANYLSSLGNWKNFQLATGFVDAVNIEGAKLRVFVIGDAVAGNVTTNIPSLGFLNTKCLESIDARNAASLRGSIDLSVCTRLISADFSGTSVTQLILPNGSKIEELVLSDATNAILLKNLQFLEDLTFPSDVSIIRTLLIERCLYQDAFGILIELFNSDNAAIQYIRLIWTSIKNVVSDDITMLALISDNKKKDGETSISYGGINDAGDLTGRPIIEGTIRLTTGLYLSDLQALQITQIEDYPGGLKRALSSLFGTLYIIFDENLVYIPFEDSAVFAIALAHWGDGTGVTMSAAAAVTTLSSYFKNNTDIQTFNELQYFTGLTAINGGYTTGAFRYCSNLRSVVLPSSVVTLQREAFTNCTSLASINLANIVTVEEDALSNTRALVSVEVTMNRLKTVIRNAFYESCLKVHLGAALETVGDWGFAKRTTSGTGGVMGELNCPNLTSIGKGAFYGNTLITKIVNLGSITNIPTYGSYTTGTFAKCTGLTEVAFPNTLVTVNNNAFADDVNISKINILDLEAYLKIDFTNASAYPFYASTVATRGLYLNGELVENVIVPNTITAIKRYCFYKNNTIKSITIPSVITSIGDSAFQYCSNLIGAITIPSSVTSLGGTIFSYCNNITDLICNSSINISSATFFNSGNASAGAGNGTGKFYAAGNFSNNANYFSSFRKYVFCGNFTNTGGSSGTLRGGTINGHSSIEIIKIKGDFSTNCSSAATCGPIQTGSNAGNFGRIAFLEIMGTITSNYDLYRDSSVDVIDGYILHLGYDVVTNNAFPCTPIIAGANHTRLAKIYVGKGLSAADDNAILSKYTNDADWGQYASKLDTWYNYVNSPDANQDFISD